MIEIQKLPHSSWLSVCSMPASVTQGADQPAEDLQTRLERGDRVGEATADGHDAADRQGRPQCRTATRSSVERAVGQAVNDEEARKGRSDERGASRGTPAALSSSTGKGSFGNRRFHESLVSFVCSDAAQGNRWDEALMGFLVGYWAGARLNPGPLLNI